MDEEQLYYKEKYFKYKLKYLTLKKQHIDGGGFSLSSSTAVKTPVTATTTATVPVVAKQKTHSVSTSEDILTELYSLLDSGNKGTVTLIYRENGQRSDAINTNNWKIKKLIPLEMENPTADDITIYNLSILDHIDKMLYKVLWLAKSKSYIPDLGKLKTYLINKLTHKFFTLSPINIFLII